MRKISTSQILIAVGLTVLLIGCILSYFKVEPYADYVLVAGALIVILRGAVASRERKDSSKTK